MPFKYVIEYCQQEQFTHFENESILRDADARENAARVATLRPVLNLLYIFSSNDLFKVSTRLVSSHACFCLVHFFIVKNTTNQVTVTFGLSTDCERDYTI